jgi:hypothetical protein
MLPLHGLGSVSYKYRNKQTPKSPFLPPEENGNAYPASEFVIKVEDDSSIRPNYAP